MKEINNLNQTNITKIFDEGNEPLLVKNNKGNTFLVLPLDSLNWQELFFYLYQIPTDTMKKHNNNKSKLSKIDSLCGSLKGFLTDSDEFSKFKNEEKDLEESKWKK
jgi:hypothetical protein